MKNWKPPLRDINIDELFREAEELDTLDTEYPSPEVYYDEDGNRIDLSDRYYKLRVPAAEDTVEVPLLEFTTEYIVDSEHPNVGVAIYDEATKVLTIHMHEGWQVNGEMNKAAVSQHLAAGHRSIPVSSVIPVAYNPTELRTCKYYSPPRDSISMGLSVSEHHKFDKAFLEHSCAHPKRQSNVCHMFQQQAVCDIGSLENWKDEVVYHSESRNTEYKVQSMRRGLGVKNYRIVTVDNDKIDVIQTTAVTDDVQAFDHSVDDLKTLIESIPDAVEKDVPSGKEVKVGFFEYAFND